MYGRGSKRSQNQVKNRNLTFSGENLKSYLVGASASAHLGSSLMSSYIFLVVKLQSMYDVVIIVMIREGVKKGPFL